MLAPNLPCQCNKGSKNARACYTNHCKCHKGGRTCNAACGCKACENLPPADGAAEDVGGGGVEPGGATGPAAGDSDGDGEDQDGVPEERGDGSDQEEVEEDAEEDDDEADSAVLRVGSLVQGERAGRGFRFQVEWERGDDGAPRAKSWMSTTDFEAQQEWQL